MLSQDANKICLPRDGTKGQAKGAKPNGIMLEGCGGWRDPNQIYLVLCIGNSPWGVYFPNIPAALWESVSWQRLGSAETGSSLDNLDNRRPELQPGPVLVQT